MKVAIIPARGGSKRIPRKNVRPFCGKPMIGWSIDAALESSCFDRIIVSTDDPEIAAIAISLGAEAPFSRPPELSTDHVATAPVIRHALEWLQQSTGAAPESACCIYATAPFLRPGDLKLGMQSLLDSGADFSFSVTSFEFPIQRAVRIRKDGRVEMISPENYLVRSQDLEEAFHDAGQFYWGMAAAWMRETPIFTANSQAVRLPRYRVQDIDSEEDWKRAELMFQALKGEMT
jgi:N-acylneuraminate cytidylyltransferase